MQPLDPAILAPTAGTTTPGTPAQSLIVAQAPFLSCAGDTGGNTAFSKFIPERDRLGQGWLTSELCPLSTLDPSPRARARHRLLLRFSQHSEHVGTHVDKTLASHLGSVRQEPQQAPAREGIGGNRPCVRVLIEVWGLLCTTRSIPDLRSKESACKKKKKNLPAV